MNNNEYSEIRTQINCTHTHSFNYCRKLIAQFKCFGMQTLHDEYTKSRNCSNQIDYELIFWFQSEEIA